MAGTEIPKRLIKLIEKWMHNKKTGSLQINFIKGEINSAFINLAINLENNETLAAKGILGGNSWLTWLNKLSNFTVGFYNHRRPMKNCCRFLNPRNRFC